MLIKFFKSLSKDQKGATAIEYGLIAALISIVAIGALTSVGENLSTTFDSVATELDTAANSGGGTTP